MSAGDCWAEAKEEEEEESSEVYPGKAVKGGVSRVSKYSGWRWWLEEEEEEEEEEEGRRCLFWRWMNACLFLVRAPNSE